ncbi:MAG TPA: hypothetical protein VFB59_02105 [Candidatus Saccharimonadales bacterium]|nr:hypothetical protein [Candidatus Saccharimonadales bacterium]
MAPEITSAIENSLSSDGRQVIFVCGLSGAGKTEFCNDVQRELSRESVIVRTDWYLTYGSLERRRRIYKAFDDNNAEAIEREANPKNWYSWDRFKSDVKALRSLGQLQLSAAWDQRTGEKHLSVELQVASDGVIICDGIYLLDPAICEYTDVTVLLDVSPDTTKERAGKRDQHRNPGSYLALKESLKEKYDVPYFEQYRQLADIIIDNNDFNNTMLIKP